MAEDKQSSGEKEFDPTDRKLEKAREEGNVPRTQEVAAAFALILATVIVGSQAHMVAQPMLDMVHALYSIDALHVLQAGGSLAPIIVPAIAKAVLPIVAILACAGVFINLVETGFTLPSGDKAGLKVDLKRIDVLSNIKEKFGLKMVFDAIKNILKLTLVATALVFSAHEVFEKTPALLGLSPLGLTSALSDQIGDALFRIALIAIAIAVLDYVLEKYRFTRKMKMSRQDIKDELKQSEGDPQVKAARKKRQRDMVMNAPLASVGDATVLVANPTHFSVTLRYNRGDDAAPVVLGRGKDRIALAMREKARESGVPIVENKPLARALYAVGKEGHAIPADFFRAVAEVLAYVMAAPGSGAMPPPPAEIPDSAKDAMRRLGLVGES